MASAGGAATPVLAPLKLKLESFVSSTRSCYVVSCTEEVKVPLLLSNIHFKVMGHNPRKKMLARSCGPVVRDYFFTVNSEQDLTVTIYFTIKLSEEQLDGARGSNVTNGRLSQRSIKLILVVMCCWRSCRQPQYSLHDHTCDELFVSVLGKRVSG